IYSLKCQICISPMETHGTPLIKWYFNNSKSCGIKKILQYTDHVINSPDNRNIIIYSVKLEQAGIYWCEVGDTIGSIYYLYVDNDFETVTIHPNKATLVEYIPEYKVKIYTSWTTWSPCSTCDVVGIKLRYGYCTVSLIEMPEHEYLNNLITINKLQHRKRDDEWNQEHKNTKMTNTTLNVQLQMALMLFKNKLPCISSLLPEQVRLIPVIKKKKTAIMRRYCKKKCQKNIIFEVRDEKGNVLESANNSAGIYSMIQGMPELLPSIARNVLYEKYDTRFKLVCPG
ncbi:uncharacterized protein, partial [Cardiocondyla obscurior]|uniref:uncharacterized protein n=1 Tax=Cardiocondyla obscurior TaxID=286306 RepID=UPI0039655F64